MRTMTAATIAGLLNQTCPGAVVFLLKIEHESLGSSLYYTNNTVDLTYAGQVYTAAGFRIDLPSETESEISEGKIVFCGVDQSIMTLLRTLQYPRPLLTLVAAYWTESGTFDTFMPQYLYIDSVTGEGQTVAANLTLGDNLKCGLGMISFMPNDFPGLF